MKLFGFFRSSAAYRVRIALDLKGLAYDAAFVDLRQGRQFEDGYATRNRQNLVPTLEDDGLILNQSLAIIEYLDERYPDPPLLPADAGGRARVRAMAQGIACEIQPLNNTRVMIHLEHTLGLDEERRTAWSIHWIERGFAALEARLAESPMTGEFCHGKAPTLADVCLVPQVYNARRQDMDLAAFPTMRRIEEACLALPAFDRARPENQPDAV